MLNRNLICLLIGVFLLIGIFSFAHELPTVYVTSNSGSTWTISSFGDSYDAWDHHEDVLNEANDKMQQLTYELAIIDAGISKNRDELRRLKTVTILVAGKKVGFGAAVNAIVDLLDNGDTYEMGLRRISKYSEIDSQNSSIKSAASNRDEFYPEFVRRWDHRETHRTSQGTSAPGKRNGVEQKSIPMLGAACKNSCGVFWYDSFYESYYSSFEGGIAASLGAIPELARSSHQPTCTGTESCGDPYWTCEGAESGGTARHTLRSPHHLHRRHRH